MVQNGWSPFFKRVPDVIRNEARKSLARSAEDLVGMMKRLAPVRSGALRDSIKWTFGNAPVGATKLKQLKQREGNKDLRVTIYVTDFKARWMEYGTMTSRGEGASYRMTPKPFFYRSYRARRKQMGSDLTKALNRAIKQLKNTPSFIGVDIEDEAA